MTFLQQKVKVPPKIIPKAPFPRIELGGLSATQLHPEWVAHHIFDEQGKKQSLDNLLKGSSANIWKQAITNELARLSQGIKGKISGTNAVRFIKNTKYHEVKQ